MPSSSQPDRAIRLPSRFFVLWLSGWLLVGSTAATGCGEATGPTRPGTPLVGEWGGEGIALVLNENGGTVEFDCARGVLQQPVEPDQSGRFQAAGTYSARRPGPEPVEGPAPEPATYEGTLDGNTMTLTVKLAGSGQRVTTVTATRDQVPRLRRCL